MNETKNHMINESWDTLGRYSDVNVIRTADIGDKLDVKLRTVSRTSSATSSGVGSPVRGGGTPIKQQNIYNQQLLQQLLSYGPGYPGNNSPFHSPSHSITSNESSPSALVNYSPKHNRKPSSLSLNRNINMKGLSLNIEDKERAKSLTLSIPNNSPPKSAVISNSPTSSISSSSSSTTTNTVLLTSGKLPAVNTAATATTHVVGDANTTTNTTNTTNTTTNTVPGIAPLPKSIQTSNNYKFPDTIDDFKQLLINKVPEELQELDQLDAYPNGPSNVLNGCIYLYSEPSIEDLQSFDLVINVAKECPQITDFKGKYVYIPWNHTSSISKDLAYLTSVIKEYDDSDKVSERTKGNLRNKLNDSPNPNDNNLNDNEYNECRKILVHCQCGVSRSACVVVAYFMLKFNLNVNDAYELLKSGTSPDSKTAINKKIYNMGYSILSCTRVCPNMSLIFELMDFYETIKPT